MTCILCNDQQGAVSFRKHKHQFVNTTFRVRGHGGEGFRGARLCFKNSNMEAGNITVTVSVFYLQFMAESCDEGLSSIMNLGFSPASSSWRRGWMCGPIRRLLDGDVMENSRTLLCILQHIFSSRDFWLTQQCTRRHFCPRGQRLVCCVCWLHLYVNRVLAGVRC